VLLLPGPAASAGGLAYDSSMQLVVGFFFSSAGEGGVAVGDPLLWNSVQFIEVEVKAEWHNLHFMQAAYCQCFFSSLK
jgi:hypothetical protein